jgi:hypothetical protein
MEMLSNNFITQQSGNLRKFLTNLIKSKTAVCPDLLITPVFQVLIDEDWVPELLLIMNVCPALVKYSTTLLTFDSFITPSPYTAIS